MGHSKLCQDLTTFYKEGKCVPCEKPDVGRGLTNNCGYDDDGGRHEPPSVKCTDGYFNDGTGFFCKPCSSCSPGLMAVKPCSPKADTACLPTQPITTPSVKTDLGIYTVPPETWVLPLTFIISATLVILSCIFVYSRKGYRRKQQRDCQLTPAVQEIPQLKDIFSPDLLEAPIICVLDNLDVLEELIILLDPETQGIKNTRHLASLCSFSSSWVTYTYSMKETKSPLRALLEGITCKNPEWTVGNLAQLLVLMERMDAVMALSKIQPENLDIIDV